MTADGAADIRPPVFAGGLNRSSSPAPSTGSNSSRRHRRTDSSAVDSDDYFGNLPRVAGDRSYRSLPGTPRERLRRNISFSPRIQFHDVWSATEYDRRGDIATCNRLTPMLAQQIKEELNTFKMVSLLLCALSRPQTDVSCRKWKYTSCPRCTHTSFNDTKPHEHGCMAQEMVMILA